MTENIEIKEPVLITGNSKQVCPIAVCLMLARQPVVVLSQNIHSTLESFQDHIADLANRSISLDMGLVSITDKPERKNYSLAIICTNENLLVKKTLISLVEDMLGLDKTIAINTESIPLSSIQKRAKFPARILGANWVNPAHTTYFLEIISNKNTDKNLTKDFADHARKNWQKDPYIINGDHGIRARLMCALIREAFYLVENGYVSFEDIDRACRNDAGYYLPFAGNFRYMDLMGTYIYGVVMKDMNPDLSKQQHVPAFFKTMMQQGKMGMDDGQGFYDYNEGDAEKWNMLARDFSYQIRDIVEKYRE